MKLFRLLLALRATGGRAWIALRDVRVPRRLKLIALAALVFVLSPLNVLGDIPLLGIADDGALVGLILVWFNRASLPYLQTYGDAGPAARP